MKPGDFIAVVDLESACYDEVKRPLEDREIIQIGLAIINVQTLKIDQMADIIVKPRKARISEFCERLTGLTQERVDAGMDFADACETLLKTYNTGQMPMASYGDYDRNHLTAWCNLTGVRYPFGPRHINVKTLTMLGFGLPKECGLDKAAELAWNGEVVGRHHDGADDAHTTAKLLVLWLSAMQHAGNELTTRFLLESKRKERVRR